MNEIHVLQVGPEDLCRSVGLPGYVEYLYLEEITNPLEREFDLVFLDRGLKEEELNILYSCTKTYGLYVLEGVTAEGEFSVFIRRKKGKRIAREELGQFLMKEAKFFFPKPYGEKYDLKNLSINRGFQGTITWNGNVDVSLAGDFGKEFRQIAYFRNYIPIEEGQTLDFWFEYKKGPGVSLQLEINKLPSGSIDFIERKWVFDEEALDEVIQLENLTGRGNLEVSIKAKGLGSLQIVALHDRFSRGKHGYFLPGGERYVTSKREELFCYFDPGDLKPPLNVYFSGYKTLEGFEGYNIMKRAGAPFLLISEPRLEGGNFYLGSAEYEARIVEVIKAKMDELGFASDEVVFTGLSMGTFGALYYGCDIQPHAIVIGKPLTSLGDIAVNERINRPGGFPTSLDVMMYQCEEAKEEKAEELNNRFWDKFESSDFSKTKFIIAYMMEDDYDSMAYEEIISHLSSEGVQVYGKGLHGRHNDNTGGIVQWFLDQFYSVLQNDFNRKTGR